MAKPNFKFQKRQKELERKKKNEEKMQRKQDKTGVQTAENQPQEMIEMPAETLGI